MRLWEVEFEVYRNIPSLPRPGTVVDEIQKEPSYRNSGRKRAGMQGCQLSYTLEGEGRFFENGTEHRLLPGTAFLHKHDDKGTVYYYPPNETKVWRFLWISFYGETLDRMVMDLVNRYGYIYKLPRNRGIIKRLEGYRNYRDAVQALTPLGGAKLVMDVLTSLGESFEKEHENDPQSNLVRKAQQMIFENLHKNMGINDIADKLQVSREHLSRVFKQQAGVSPIDYIIQRKIKFACHLLKNTNFTCKEIAERIGYENPTSFTRAFKNILKISPKELRRIGYIPKLEIS